MKRRDFIKGTSTAAAGAALAGSAVPASADHHKKGKKHKFKLKYAPHFNTFKASAGEDLADQLKFAADRGFTAWEDNRLKSRSLEDQNKIAKTMDQLGMHMGVFVAHGSIEGGRRMLIGSRLRWSEGKGEGQVSVALKIGDAKVVLE